MTVRGLILVPVVIGTNASPNRSGHVIPGRTSRPFDRSAISIPTAVTNNEEKESNVRWLAEHMHTTGYPRIINPRGLLSFFVALALSFFSHHLSLNCIGETDKSSSPFLFFLLFLPRKKGTSDIAPVETARRKALLLAPWQGGVVFCCYSY